MKIFQCQSCSQPVYFENTYCENCGHTLGYLASELKLYVIIPKGSSFQILNGNSTYYNYCQNYAHGVCNWLVPVKSNTSLCEACKLNQTIPNLNNPKHFKAWQKLEKAKHRLIYSLQRFNLPVKSKIEAPNLGLAFAFLSDENINSNKEPLKTGHLNGLITINLVEADSVHREYIRTQMSEPYRTLIGHFRHEIGHYYWDQLVLPNPKFLASFRENFGDERTDYALAIKKYYSDERSLNWQQYYVSEYAASHPWEDWAETWAHYLHLVDALETAFTFGLSIQPNLQNVPSMNMQANFDPYLESNFDIILNACIPLTFAVNSINRSMGQPDLYPFIITQSVGKKLRFIHQLLHL